MAETVAERVRRLAEAHHATIDRADPAVRRAVAFSRIEGIEGDETLMMLGELGRRGIIAENDAYRMAALHHRECAPAQSAGATRIRRSDAGATTWNPTEDFLRRSVLRNRAGLANLEEIKQAEFVALQLRMPLAMRLLSQQARIGLTTWRKVHRVLFAGLYPWAGRQRRLDVERSGGGVNVRFNDVRWIGRDTDRAFSEIAANGLSRERLGEFYGELAFNHPFLDGNGRSLNPVFAELCRRSGFGIAWDEFGREEYLRCLTPAVLAKEYGPLQRFLHRHVVPVRQRTELDA